MTPLNPQPSRHTVPRLSCSLCTSVMPREIFTNDPATDPWVTAPYIHLFLVVPLPRESCPAKTTQSVEAWEEAGFVERQLCRHLFVDSVYSWMSTRTVYITPSCAIELWYFVISTSPCFLWVVPGDGVTLGTCADILDSSPVFGHVVPLMGILAENTPTIWTGCI